MVDSTGWDSATLLDNNELTLLLLQKVAVETAIKSVFEYRKKNHDQNVSDERAIELFKSTIDNVNSEIDNSEFYTSAKQNFTVIKRKKNRHTIPRNYHDGCIAVIPSNKHKKTDFISLESMGNQVVLVDLRQHVYRFINLDRKDRTILQNQYTTINTLCQRCYAVHHFLKNKEKRRGESIQQYFNTALKEIKKAKCLKVPNAITSSLVFAAEMNDFSSDEIVKKYPGLGLEEPFIIITNNWANLTEDHDCLLRSCDRPHDLMDMGNTTLIYYVSKGQYFFLGEDANKLIQKNIFKAWVDFSNAIATLDKDMSVFTQDALTQKKRVALTKKPVYVVKLYSDREKQRRRRLARATSDSPSCDFDPVDRMPTDEIGSRPDMLSRHPPRSLPRSLSVSESEGRPVVHSRHDRLSLQDFRLDDDLGDGLNATLGIGGNISRTSEAVSRFRPTSHSLRGRGATAESGELFLQDAENNTIQDAVFPPVFGAEGRSDSHTSPRSRAGARSGSRSARNYEAGDRLDEHSSSESESEGPLDERASARSGAAGGLDRHSFSELRTTGGHDRRSMRGRETVSRLGERSSSESESEGPLNGRASARSGAGGGLDRRSSPETMAGSGSGGHTSPRPSAVGSLGGRSAPELEAEAQSDRRMGSLSTGEQGVEDVSNGQADSLFSAASADHLAQESMGLEGDVDNTVSFGNSTSATVFETKRFNTDQAPSGVEIDLIDFTTPLDKTGKIIDSSENPLNRPPQPSPTTSFSDSPRSGPPPIAPKPPSIERYAQRPPPSRSVIVAPPPRRIFIVEPPPILGVVLSGPESAGTVSESSVVTSSTDTRGPATEPLLVPEPVTEQVPVPDKMEGSQNLGEGSIDKDTVARHDESGLIITGRRKNLDDPHYYMGTQIKPEDTSELFKKNRQKLKKPENLESLQANKKESEDYSNFLKKERNNLKKRNLERLLTEKQEPSQDSVKGGVDISTPDISKYKLKPVRENQPKDQYFKAQSSSEEE